ncbi:hypothetical protein HMN09_00647300 [Mycena chlorophos]|uniref:Uncharacterized protein n=1 Tax=Mycena chlorophos TaxID=658473 RepID=A0A8H6T3K0_MYCCL|nr:hypothetical protein HMN09_00647300 [Mycena chlorophos]
MPTLLRRVDSQSSDDTVVDTTPRTFERQLGETETSYFLPSRNNGVNDMYLHLGFHASRSTMLQLRVALVWAILRLRHPLLASKVEMTDYTDIKFVYNPPDCASDALKDAAHAIEYRTQTKEELVDVYLNGPRTLDDERLSYLIISSAEANQGPQANFDLLLCATHFLGDGMALHQCANDFFTLLSSQASLEMMLNDEWEKRVGSIKAKESLSSFGLPDSLETRLPRGADGKFQHAVNRIDFQNSQNKLIGGQSFPRQFGQERKTVVPTISYHADQTQTILKKCKTNGVSISAALFSICNHAWAQTSKEWTQPTMMYSALNLRPTLTASASLNDTYWFLAIGYFNVVLPSFFPSQPEDTERTFWHRARIAKNQSTRAAKNPMLASRSLEMARERGSRARMWAREDDEKALGIWQAPPPKSKPATGTATPTAPQTCLIGLSLLGNLDGIYKHANFPSIKLHTLTTGSRQRPGGMLLFGYTFCGKLWISLGYDENGFDENVPKFWENVQKTVETFLM